MISQKIIEEFKDIYRRKHGVLLTDQDAREKATILFAGLDVMYRPLTKKDNYDKNEN